MSSTAVHLVFVGEILPGFSLPQVREKLGRRLRLDEQRLDKLFSGKRVVIKRELSPADAAEWVHRFQVIGAVLHAVPSNPPKPTAALKRPTPPPPAPPPPRWLALPSEAPAVSARPGVSLPPDTSMMLSLVPDSEPPSPAPSASRPPPSSGGSSSTAMPASPGSEEITCPSCGERQSKRVICRSCLCDMPRTLASQKAEAEARRQARLEEQRARNEHRLAQEQARLDDADGNEALGDIPPLLSLSPEGRMGRLRYFSINTVGTVVSVVALVLAFTVVLMQPTAATLVPLSLAGLVLLLWGLRLAALRLHDFGKSGWWALLMLVPVVNGLLALALLLWPGDRDENDYGSPVDDGHWLWALLGLVIVGATAALGSPKFMSAVLKAVA